MAGVVNDKPSVIYDLVLHKHIICVNRMLIMIITYTQRRFQSGKNTEYIYLQFILTEYKIIITNVSARIIENFTDISGGHVHFKNKTKKLRVYHVLLLQNKLFVVQDHSESVNVSHKVRMKFLTYFSKISIHRFINY